MNDSRRSRLIDKAISLHKAGDHGPAASLYEEVLRRRPDDYDALYLLGVLEYQRKFDPRALDLLTRAVAAGSRQSAAHNALGLALRRLGRAGDAAKHFQEAVRLDPPVFARSLQPGHHSVCAE